MENTYPTKYRIREGSGTKLLMHSFPSFPEKVRFPSVVTARAALDARGVLNQFENIPVPRTAILCMHPEGARYYFLKFGKESVIPVSYGK